MKLLEKIQNGVYVIAEMSANHAGSLDYALQIVRAAKDAGADCLKIQTYTADTITVNCDNPYFMIKGGLWDSQKLYDLYKSAYTPWEWQRTIKEECDKVGIDFLSTPFDTTSVDFLEELGVAFYKIASFELVDIPLIEYVASKGKPIIMSCGMATVEEIKDAVDVIMNQGNDKIILLKCCSEYPANYSDMNLAVISDMARRFNCPVGISDHSMGSLAAVVGVSQGACIVEKHFCLSREIKNPDSDFSMEPNEFAKMVEDIAVAKKILGECTYNLTEREIISRKFRKSIFCIKDINEGEKITSENIRVIRPGYGLKPINYKKILGKVANKKVKFGQPIRYNSFESNDILLSYKNYIFESDRSIYTGISENDTEEIIRWRSDPDIIKYFRNAIPLTKEAHISWFTKYLCDNTRFDYIIKEKNQQTKIGVVGVQNINWESGSAEIAYMIGDLQFHHMGYGYEAVKSIINFAFNYFGCKIISAEIHKDNAPSISLISKLGFKKETKGEFIKFTLTNQIY